jgi:hypothetical protein
MARDHQQSENNTENAATKPLAAQHYAGAVMGSECLLSNRRALIMSFA